MHECNIVIVVEPACVLTISADGLTMSAGVLTFLHRVSLRVCEAHNAHSQSHRVTKWKWKEKKIFETIKKDLKMLNF